MGKGAAGKKGVGKGKKGAAQLVIKRNPYQAVPWTTVHNAAQPTVEFLQNLDIFDSVEEIRQHRPFASTTTSSGDTDLPQTSDGVIVHANADDADAGDHLWCATASSSKTGATGTATDGELVLEADVLELWKKKSARDRDASKESTSA